MCRLWQRGAPPLPGRPGERAAATPPLLLRGVLARRCWRGSRCGHGSAHKARPCAHKHARSRVGSLCAQSLRGAVCILWAVLRARSTGNRAVLVRSLWESKARHDTVEFSSVPADYGRAVTAGGYQGGLIHRCKKVVQVPLRLDVVLRKQMTGHSINLHLTQASPALNNRSGTPS